MGRKRIHPIDPIKASGLLPGTVVENPDTGETYTIGQRGRRPPWVIQVVCQGKKAVKPIPPKSTGKGLIILSGPGCYLVDGQTCSMSADAEMEVLETASIIKVG